MNTPIVLDDRMAIPLYHGTGTPFLPSIRSGGLGAKNPHVKLRTLELFAALLGARDWGNAVESEEKFLEQRVMNAGNYRHGSTYLAPLEQEAVSYALHNRYSSELLTRTFGWFKKLEQCDANKAHKIIGEFPELRELYEMPHQPILVKALGIPIRSLRTEYGEDPLDDLRFMESNHRDLWIDANFELIAAHPMDSLEFYYIENTERFWMSQTSYSLRLCD